MVVSHSPDQAWVTSPISATLKYQVREASESDDTWEHASHVHLIEKSKAAAVHDLKANKSKGVRGSCWGLYFQNSHNSGSQGSVDLKPPIPHLLRQMDCSFSHSETEFTAIFLQFNKKSSIENFLYFLLLVSGLKILSLKHKNKENENFSQKRKKKGFLRGWATERFIFLHSPWWIWLKGIWSHSWNIRLKYKGK